MGMVGGRQLLAGCRRARYISTSGGLVSACLGRSGVTQPGAVIQERVLGKSFKQQRPDGLLISQEHKPALV